MNQMNIFCIYFVKNIVTSFQNPLESLIEIEIYFYSSLLIKVLI